MTTQTEHSTEQSLERILEAVLSVSDSPISIQRLIHLFPEEARPQPSQIEDALDQLAEDYTHSALELVRLSNGYRFQTRASYAQWINKLFEIRPPRLSRALLETLSIIAYQQPATRGDIQEIRGVAVSSDLMQKLLERQWIKKIGERDVPGRPSLFATTAEFLEYFNLRSLKDLPELHQARELDDIARDLGQGIELTTAQNSASAAPDPVQLPIENMTPNPADNITGEGLDRQADHPSEPAITPEQHDA